MPLITEVEAGGSSSRLRWQWLAVYVAVLIGGVVIYAAAPWLRRSIAWLLWFIDPLKGID